MDTHFARCLQNVECEFCEFKVTDGPITGNFVARNTLILKTKFNAVDGSITVVSSTAAGIFSRSVIDITTTTGSINTNFTLIAVDAGTKERLSSGGAYGITTRSRNAPVRLEVVDASVDYALKLFSKNMRGPLEVYLHPTYQGWFSSKALVGGTPLGIRGYTENPSGHERKRNLVWDGWNIPPGIKHILSGQAWWGDRPVPLLRYRPNLLFFSSVQLKSIVGRPLVLLHVSDPDIGSHIY